MDDEETAAGGIGGQFAACIWIFTHAVMWNCQEEHGTTREWVSGFAFIVHEHVILKTLSFGTDVLCMVQWDFDWCSAQTRANSELTNGGTIVEM